MESVPTKAQKETIMPKTSLPGSIFPGLEQEQRSQPHSERTKNGTLNVKENIQKTEKNKENKR